jgi:threonine/homoserine/homoserine lactone efflux protein
MAYLASLVLRRGRGAGLIATAGIAFGLTVHATLAALGAGALIERFPFLYDVIRWIGITYLFFLAWEGWWPSAKGSEEIREVASVADARSLFMRGFLSNVFNPKSIIFFISVVPGYIGVSADLRAIPTQMAELGFIAVLVGTVVHSCIVLFADSSDRWLANESAKDVVRKILSSTLAMMTLWLAWVTLHD